MDSSRLDRLMNFCEVYIPVILEHDQPADSGERLHLVLDHDGGTVHAEVSIDGRTGFGSAPRTDMAAARTALTAVSENAKLTNVGAVRAGEDGAAFVVAAGEKVRLTMGAAPIAGGLTPLPPLQRSEPARHWLPSGSSALLPGKSKRVH